MKIFGYIYNWKLVSCVILVVVALMHPEVIGLVPVMKILLRYEIIGHSLVIVGFTLIHTISRLMYRNEMRKENLEYRNS